MNTQQTPATTAVDILALLEETPVVENIATPLPEDPLSEIESIQQIVSFENETKEIKRESALTRFRRASVPKIQFAFYYLSISTIVFTILLATTNWNSYSTLLSAYLNPGALSESEHNIISVLDKSRVTVYADSTNDSENKEDELTLKKKLEESNTTIREDRFSPKRLIPAETKMNVDLDITPYDNRIIIPKIGKNIPMVDVRIDAGFDFDHMENIFMRELEKGVVRYPGTARPGEAGNAFIF